MKSRKKREEKDIIAEKEICLLSHQPFPFVYKKRKLKYLGMTHWQQNMILLHQFKLHFF